MIVLLKNVARNTSKTCRTRKTEGKKKRHFLNIHLKKNTIKQLNF